MLELFIPELCDSESIDNLLAAFDHVDSGAPDDLDEYVRQRLSANNLPSPWVTWTLVGLSQYRRRQLWAREIAFHRLMSEIPEFRMALETDQYLKGFVPDHPEWTFQLTCVESSLDLHNRVTGEVITVGIRDYDADCGFHRLAFKEWFTEFRPQFSLAWKQRLEELHPLEDSIGFSMTELTSAKCFEFLPGDEEGELEQLSEKVLARSDSIIAFCEAWENPDNRIWLSALVGDWSALCIAATDNRMAEIANLAKERAEECRTARLNKAHEWCGKLIDRDALPLFADTLYVMGELAPEVVPELLRRAFAGSRLTALYAFYYVNGIKDPTWCREVYRLLTQHPSEYHSRTAVGAASLAKYLVEHKYRVPEVVTMLARDEETVDYAALLAVEHVPEAAMGVLECALRGSNERSWCQAAAIVAVLGGPRSEALCVSAIKNTQNPLLALYCQMALYTMWGKEKLIPEQEALRQRTRCVQTGKASKCKRSCDLDCARCHDVLAEQFSWEVDQVAQHVLTFRE